MHKINTIRLLCWLFFFFFHSPRHHFSYTRLISDNRLSGSEYIASKNLFNIYLRREKKKLLFSLPLKFLLWKMVSHWESIVQKISMLESGNHTNDSTSYLWFSFSNSSLCFLLKRDAAKKFFFFLLASQFQMTFMKIDSGEWLMRIGHFPCVRITKYDCIEFKLELILLLIS